MGLLETGRVNEWVVTEKLGDHGVKNKSHVATPTPSTATKSSLRRPTSKLLDRMNFQELGFAAFLFFCGCYDLRNGKYCYYIYLFLQSITYTIVGFGYMGTII